MDNNRLKRISLIVFLCITAAVAAYFIFGHQLIKSMYEGKSLGCLNSLLSNRESNSLQHYYELFDRFAIYEIKILLFAIAFILVSYKNLGRLIKLFLNVVVIASVLLLAYLLLIDVRQFFIIMLPLFSSYLFMSVFVKSTDVIDRINVTFLILCCELVLTAQFLSLVNGINGANYLLAGIILCVSAYSISKNRKETIILDLKRVDAGKKHILECLKKNKLLAYFVLVVIISILWRMFLIVYVPINSWDSMTYHLSKVAYWIQNKSLPLSYATNFHEMARSYNAELLFLWTMVSSKADHFCGFIQLVCYILSGTILYQCCRRHLKNKIAASLAVALVWLSLPIVVLESTSTQNDLVVAYFIMLGLLYYLRAFSEGNRILLLSAVAFALALGTKETVFYFFIPFAVWVAWSALKQSIHRKKIILWISLTIAASLFLSSYSYIHNYMEFNHIFGPEQMRALHLDSHASFRHYFSSYFRTLISLAANQSGLDIYAPLLKGFYMTLCERICLAVANSLHLSLKFSAMRISLFDLSEVITYFGSLGLVLSIIAFFIIFSPVKELITKRTGKHYLRYGIFAYLFIAYLLVMTYTTKWGVYLSRFLITMMLIGMPILAVIFDSERAKLKKISSLIVVYSMAILVPSSFYGNAKPLPIILKNDKDALMYVERPEMRVKFSAYYSIVEPTAKVGIILPELSWTYPFFGKRLTRTVVPVKEYETVIPKLDYIVCDKEILKNNNTLETLLLRDYKLTKELVTDDGWPSWLLYTSKKQHR